MHYGIEFDCCQFRSMGHFAGQKRPYTLYIQMIPTVKLLEVNFTNVQVMQMAQKKRETSMFLFYVPGTGTL